MSTEVELRCPADHRRLFGKILRDGTITHGNLIEVACPACRRSVKAQGITVVRVLHRFNVLGVCVETEFVEDGKTPG